MITLLYFGAMWTTAIGIGMALGERRETWIETRRNVREEMQYEAV